MKGLGLALALMSVLAFTACGPAEPETASAKKSPASVPSLDRGAIRSSIVDGLEAAAEDRTLQAGMAEALRVHVDEEPVGIAAQRALARVFADAELTRVADEFFAALHETTAVRQALAQYARDNPELDLGELTEGFSAYIDARLTRTELVVVIDHELRRLLSTQIEAAGLALLLEGGGTEAMAELVLHRLDDPAFVEALRGRLGNDPAALIARLQRRLAEPRRAIELGDLFTAALREPEAGSLIVSVLDAEETAALISASAVRVLEDPEFRSEAQEVFALALTEPLDPDLGNQLFNLLRHEALLRELDLALRSSARQGPTRDALAKLVAGLSAREGLDAELLSIVD